MNIFPHMKSWSITWSIWMFNMKMKTLLYSCCHSFLNPTTIFVNTIIDNHDTLILDEVCTTLDSKEKAKHITGCGSSDVKSECLNVKGRKIDRGKTSQSSNKARSKSKCKRIIFNYCHKKENWIYECFKLKNKYKTTTNGK